MVCGCWTPYFYMKQNWKTSCFKWGEGELKGGDGGDLNNVQCKSNCSCHYESPCIMNIS
jgi:hypothetical protein